MEHVHVRPQFMIDLGIEEGCLHWDDDSKFLEDTIQISQPKNILEIGYFCGGSAAMWLHLSEANLTSVDPMVNLYDPSVKHDGSIESVDRLKNAFPQRFSFIQKDSKKVCPDLLGQKFDLMFIDGDHMEIGVRNDFQLAIDLDISWILVDDFVTSVLQVYQNEFRNEFFPVRVYNRRDMFQGAPIPIVLLKKVNKQIRSKL